MNKTIQELQITRVELEKLDEDFLMRALRIFALQEDWIRFSIAAGFLQDFLRAKVFPFILKGPFGLREINSQAKEGRGLFAIAGRPSEQEKMFGKMIDKYIEQGGQEDIVFAIGDNMGKKLLVSEIEDIVLDCINRKRFNIAQEAANSLPWTKRAQVIAILS